MKTKLVVAFLAIAAMAFVTTAAMALRPIPQMEGYYKFGYFDGNTYAAKCVPGIGAIKVYVLPDMRTLYLGIVVDDAIYFQDRTHNEPDWGVLTELDADTFLVVSHDADTGETKEMTVVRITEEEANEIAEKQEEENDSQNCMHNLKVIGLLLHRFANENEGELPYDLSELYPNYTASKNLFMCPARGGQFHEFDSDYEYIPGFRSDSPNPGEEAVLIEVPGNHTGGFHHILFLDGHVEKRSF